MTPRASTPSPSTGRDRLRHLAVACALLAAAVLPDAASATLTSISTRPAAPTVCDSVALLVAGTMPDPCHHVIGAEIEGPTLLPTMGPLPVYAIGVRITVQEPNPMVDHICPMVLQAYDRGFRLGKLGFGRYLVHAVEYLVPFTADSTAAPKDSSTLDSAFEVSVSPTVDCRPGAGCAILSFGPSDLPSGGRCDATAGPGGTACFEVRLLNTRPAAGVQTEIAVYQAGSDSTPPTPTDLLRPISVDLTRRDAGFKVDWTAEGSRVKIVLFSATNASIPAGEGAILRVCYAVAAGTPEGRYPMRFQNSIVADPDGVQIPPCPTVAEIVGWICVAKTGCDLNGDGRSDILDIVQLVHCALGGHGSAACPDSVAAKADCNEDGVLDVRDVICCVRKILAAGGLGSGGGTPPDSTGATTIGFTGPARWTAPGEGLATIEIDPGSGFAGMQFGIDGSSSPARIRDLRLLDPQGAYQLESSIDQGGSSAQAMLFSSGNASPVGPIRLEVFLAPADGSSGAGALRLLAPRSATQSAQAMATRTTAATAAVPPSPGADAPSLSVPAPNPFAMGTEVAYSLPSPLLVTLRIYNASGRLIRTLVDGSMPAGIHRAAWDGRDSGGRDAGSGIYFFKFKAGDVERTVRVMRLR